MSDARKEIAHALERKTSEGSLLCRAKNQRNGRRSVDASRRAERRNETRRTLDLLLQHFQVPSVSSNQTSLSVSLSSNVVSNLLRLLLLGELSNSVSWDEILEDGEERDDGESSDARRVGDSFQVGVGVGNGRKSEGGESSDERNLEKGSQVEGRGQLRRRCASRRKEKEVNSRYRRPLHH